MIRTQAKALFSEVAAGSARKGAADRKLGAATRSRVIGRVAKGAAILACASGLAGAAYAEGIENDYPTDARVDYVFGCMAANGQTRESMEKCSCSIDALAAILPFDKYVQANTILSMRQGAGGQRTTAFKSTKVFDDRVADLRRAQAEAEIRCYRGSAG